jgi:hypothetical protein
MRLIPSTMFTVLMICLTGVSAVAQEMTLALTGDAIITRRLSVYDEPDFLEMIELIRGADAAFTNLEMLFHDFEPYPAHQSGGTWMRGDPALLEELTWAGIDMVSRDCASPRGTSMKPASCTRAQVRASRKHGRRVSWRPLVGGWRSFRWLPRSRSIHEPAKPVAA